MKIPIKITPCPIVDATIEIKFETDVVPNAVFGIVYNAFREKSPTVTNLPVTQIPEDIRNRDPQLLQQSHHRLSYGNFAIQIGPTGISVGNIDEYVGWKIFLEEATKTFQTFGQLNIAKKIIRLGIRYINLFHSDVFDKVDLRIFLKESGLRTDNMFIRVEMPSNDFLNILQVSNNASGTVQGKPFAGSVIDIDTITTKNLDSFFENVSNRLIAGHEEEKKLFFSLLKPEFLASLNPVYAEGQ